MDLAEFLDFDRKNTVEGHQLQRADFSVEALFQNLRDQQTLDS